MPKPPLFGISDWHWKLLWINFFPHLGNLGNRRGLWWISLSFLFFHNNWCSWGCSVSFVAELMTFEVNQHFVLLFYNFKKGWEGNSILMYCNIIIPTATKSFHWNKIEINEMKCDVFPWQVERNWPMANWDQFRQGRSMGRLGVSPWPLGVGCVGKEVFRAPKSGLSHAFPMSSW